MMLVNQALGMIRIAEEMQQKLDDLSQLIWSQTHVMTLNLYCSCDETWSILFHYYRNKKCLWDKGKVLTFFFLEEENLIVQSSLENDRKCGLINAFLHAFLEASMPKIWSTCDHLPNRASATRRHLCLPSVFSIGLSSKKNLLKLSTKICWKNRRLWSHGCFLLLFSLPCLLFYYKLRRMLLKA